MDQEFERGASLGSEIPQEDAKNRSAKKIIGGCGCGCLVILIVLTGLLYWGYRHLTSYVREFEEQGYALHFDQEVSIHSGVITEGPLVFFAQKVTVDGTIQGDVAAMCQHLTINGTIDGDLHVKAQLVTISATGVVTGAMHSDGVQVFKNDGRVDGEISGTFQVSK
ncbi:MAG: polymer-forming cytoskeletal protein [Phycisphaerales bacterium]|jgi:hypothetical protein|nr:polymer-forming cytoskeletal protein [Phycisphaerales bacterium]